MGADRKQLDAALAEAREIAKRTDLNDEERTDLSKRVETIERMKSDIRVADALRAEEDESAKDGAPRNWKSQFLASDEFSEYKRRGFHGDLTFEVKAEPTVIDETTALPNLVVADRVNTIEVLGTPIVGGIVSQIPVIPTSSNAVTYFQHSSTTETIAPAAEGAEKGNLTLAGAQVSDEVEVIAGMAALTRQALEDVPFLLGFVESEMKRQMAYELERGVLIGSGTTPQLVGVDTRTTTARSQGTDTTLDAIYKAIDDVFEVGYEADSVVIKPSDWQPIALSKDGVDRYYGTGPFASAIGDSVWGVRVFKSRNLTAGQVFVGAFKTACFLARNGGETIRMSDSHSDYFKFNKVAVLLEQRVAFGMPAPLAFVDLDLA